MRFLSPNQRRQSGEGKDDFSRYREWNILINLRYVLSCAPQSSSERLIPVGDEDVTVALAGRDGSWPLEAVQFRLRHSVELVRRSVYVDVGRSVVHDVQLASQYRQPHHLFDEKKRSETRKHCARAGCSKVRTPPARPPAVTNPQTGPITIHCAAAS